MYQDLSAGGLLMVDIELTKKSLRLAYGSKDFSLGITATGK